MSQAHFMCVGSSNLPIKIAHVGGMTIGGFKASW